MRQLKRIIVLSMVASLAALAAGCGRPSGEEEGGVRRIEVVMTEKGPSEYAFEPKRIAVAPGERVEFVLRNEGKEEHEFEGETAGLEEVVVPPGKERAVAWTAPRKAGTYEIVCDLPGHRERGMVMAVEVR